MIKVMYVANQYDYGFTDWGDSYEKMHWYDTFINMPNVEVVLFDYYQEFNKTKSRYEMSKSMVKFYNEHKPDFLFANFMDLNSDPEFWAIDEITKKGCHTFFWSSDDRMRYGGYARLWAPYFRWMGTMYDPAVQWYHRDGFGNKVIRTEYAANHFNFKRTDIEKEYDIIFVGQAHSDRKELVKMIDDAGFSLKIFGRGWEREGAYKLKTCKEYVDAINKGIININFSKSSDGDQMQVNGRFFEIPMCGGFLLTGRPSDETSKYFNDEDLAYYDSKENMIDLLRFYLENEKERERISNNGMKRSLEQHTYEKRFNDIFKGIGL